jgi:NACHT domain
VLVVAIALAVGWAEVANQGVLHGGRAGLVSAILALGVLVALAGPNWLFRGTSGAGADLSLAQVADQLAVAVGKQWQDEFAWQRLNNPQPLPIAWRPADLDLVEPWDNLASTARGWPAAPQVDPARWAASPAELAGVDNDLADRLGRIPTGRLIVLGEPGAGKTMLLVRLVLDLLAKRAPGDPVPVLVSLAGWDPDDDDEDLATWLTRRLILNHQGLDEPAPPGAGAVSQARALLDQQLLLPILDGLDELPQALWRRAVTRLNDWLPPRQGLVVAAAPRPTGRRPPLPTRRVACRCGCGARPGSSCAR